MAEKKGPTDRISDLATVGVCAVASAILLIALYSFETQQLKRTFTGELAQVRAKLENLVSEAIAPTTALRSLVIARKGLPADEEFSAFAESLHDGAPHLLAAQLAPDAVVRLTTRPKANESAIGHDLIKDPKRRETAIRTIAENRTILAGPVKLIQGGDAIIARKPIFLNGAVSRTGVPDFFGFATALVDATGIYEGVSANWTDMALIGRHGLGEIGDLIHGNAAVLTNSAIRMQVTLPNGHWVLAHRAPDIADVGWQMALAGLICLVATVFVIRSRSDRRTARMAARREAERLQLASVIGNLGFIERGENGYRLSAGARRILGSENDGRLPADITPTLEVMLGGPVAERPAAPVEVVLSAGGGDRTIELLPSPASSELEIVTVRDISEAAARKSRELGMAKLVSIGELAAGIAHELNTPLQFISDNLDYLRRVASALVSGATQGKDGKFAVAGDVYSEFADEAPSALDDCLDGTRSMARIVAAMRSYAAPSRPDDPTNVAIRDVLDDAVSLTAGAHRHTAEIEMDLGDARLLAKCDAVEMTQVFINLINNACDAIRSRRELDPDAPLGRVAIAVSEECDSVKITVRDNGGGIPAAIRGRIFDLFFTTKPVGKGTGQGLAICKAILNRNGGDIEYRPAPPDGSEFLITIRRGERD